MANEVLPSHIGPYEIVGLLGRGGMGSVYKAVKPPLRRPVAVKTIKSEFISTPGALERFRREAELASELKHPNIVTVYDYEEVANGDSYIVTELIEGGKTLRDRLTDGGPLSLDESAEILRQVSSALDYAYDKAQIVHRDIKPSNVFLEDDKRAALGDFGIAKSIASDTGLTAVNQGVGTPDYMSPEQAMGEPLDRRSDIYSLGVVLYEMLTGSVPFKGDTPISVVMAHIQKPVPELRLVNPNFSPAVQNVVSRAMAKKKEDRFANANEMYQAFVAATKQASGGVFVPTMPTRNDATQPVSTGPMSYVSGQMTQVAQLESQGKYQEAFDRLEELHRQYPQDQTISKRYQSFRGQGYTYKGTTSANMPATRPGGLPQNSGTYVPPRPTPAPVNAGGSGPKKSSPLPFVVGGIAAALVVAVIALVAILAGGNSADKNATATALAIAALPTATASPTVVPATSTVAPTATQAATATAVPPTATTAPTPTVNPVSQAAQLDTEGEALFKQSNYKDAAEKMKQAVKLDPTVARYQEYLARSYISLRQYSDAEAPAKKMVELQPTNADYQYYLGIVYYRTSRPVDAEKAFREAVKLKPDDWLSYQYLSSSLFDQDRYPDAEAAAKKAIDLNPGDPENHNAIGRVYYETLRYAEAEAAFRKAASLNSASAVYPYNVAISLNNQGKYKEGEEQARLSLKLDNNYAVSYRALSIALRNQDRNDEALVAALKAADLEPKEPTHPAHAALALINLKRYSEAETLARKAVNLGSTSFTQNTLGDALYPQEKYKEALEAYSSAVSKNSRSWIFLTNQANTYSKLGDFAKARDAYNRAIALNKDYKPAVDGLAAIKDK